MDELTKKYNEYKKAMEIQQKYNNKDLKYVTVTCSTCDGKISFNGIGSHSKIHESIINDKLEFLKKTYNFYVNSIVSGKSIKYGNNTRKNKYIVVINSKEYKEICNYINNYEKNFKLCAICEKPIIKKSKTCSYNCSKKLISNGLKEYWSDDKNKENIENRNKKISDLSKIYNLNRIPWNKNITGEEYIKHYIDDNGVNSMLEGFKKSNFIPITSIENKIKDFLEKNNFKYQHSWFTSMKQFDFLLSLDNNIIIIECDGDYWHKSKRKCSDEDERKLKRIEDKLKENIIYKIKSDKKWYVFRFWEYDINKNFEKIERYLIDIKENENLIEQKYKEIKDWYEEQS